jgi:hypothetical protein
MCLGAGIGLYSRRHDGVARQETCMYTTAATLSGSKDTGHVRWVLGICTEQLTQDVV